MENDRPIVRVRQGQLRGIIQESPVGGNYVAFKGIPYAMPPIGERRFKDPEPIEEWKGVRDASDFGNVCAHYNIMIRDIVGSDDCLYLNVYVKTLDPRAKKPVMVWIHGGGFQTGSGNDDVYGADFLVRKDVVLVTINYRCGVLGFFNLEEELAPGNQGLKDQVMALQWVKDNIANFGGDPNNVTIFGESAGGAAVHYLLMSPLTKGLFHKAIAQSGVAINPWALANAEPRKYAFELGAHLGKRTTDSKTLIEFLRTVDSRDLIKAQAKLVKGNIMDEIVRLRVPFGPTVDIHSKNPFLPEPPSVAMLRGIKVPFIIGFLENEGGFFAKFTDHSLKKLNENFENILCEEAVENLKKDGVCFDKLRKAYFGDGPITAADQQKYGDFLSDLMINSGIHQVVDVQMAQNHPQTYFYHFCYEGPTPSPMKTVMDVNLKGAVHAEDLLYLFYAHMMSNMGLVFPEPGSTAAKVSDRLVEMWTNFAKTGNPTPQKTELIPTIWEPVRNGNTYNYLVIDEGLHMETKDKSSQRHDWTRLKNKL